MVADHTIRGRNTFSIEKYKGKGKGIQVWRWRFKLNTEIIAKSDEPYLKTSIYKAVSNLIEKAGDHPTRVFQGKNKKWYWHMKSGNGKIVAVSASGYEEKDIAVSFLAKFVDYVQQC